MSEHKAMDRYGIHTPIYFSCYTQEYHLFKEVDNVYFDQKTAYF